MLQKENYMQDIFNVNKNVVNNKLKSFPYDIVSVDSNTNCDLLNNFTGERTGFVQVGPKKYFFPSRYAENAHYYYNFKVRPDDVFIITFPRSGTTWTQEMVWLLANDLDYQKASEIPLTERFPFLEFSSFVHRETKAEFLKENQYDPEKYKLVQNIDVPGWKILNNWHTRRFIKTHLPFSLLPPDLLEIGCKVIYVARNPKDVAVSFYHLNRLIRTQGYSGDFATYWNYFEKNLQPWTPFWEHLKEGWNRRHNRNVLFMFYEDMNKNLRESIEKVASFMDKSYTQEDMAVLEDHLHIKNFRNNKSVNFDILKHLGILKNGEESFVRNGKSSGWRDYFNDELNSRADKWIDENLKATDMRFPQ